MSSTVSNRLSQRPQAALKEIGAAFPVKAPIIRTPTAGELIVYIREGRALVTAVRILNLAPSYFLDLILIDKIQNTVYTSLNHWVNW
jgi:hypothetical protein